MSEAPAADALTSARWTRSLAELSACMHSDSPDMARWTRSLAELSACMHSVSQNLATLAAAWSVPVSEARITRTVPVQEPPAAWHGPEKPLRVRELTLAEMTYDGQ